MQYFQGQEVKSRTQRNVSRILIEFRIRDLIRSLAGHLKSNSKIVVLDYMYISFASLFSKSVKWTASSVAEKPLIFVMNTSFYSMMCSQNMTKVKVWSTLDRGKFLFSNLCLGLQF